MYLLTHRSLPPIRSPLPIPPTRRPSAAAAHLPHLTARGLPGETREDEMHDDTKSTRSCPFDALPTSHKQVPPSHAPQMPVPDIPGSIRRPLLPTVGPWPGRSQIPLRGGGRTLLGISVWCFLSNDRCVRNPRAHRIHTHPFKTNTGASRAENREFQNHSR